MIRSRDEHVRRASSAKQTASWLTVSLILFNVIALQAATQRAWQTGTVVDYERQVVPQGSRITTNTDGQARNDNGRVRYSENSTTTATNDEDTYQVYTIRTPGTTYIVSEKLWFPWSKPTSVIVGGAVKYAIDGNKMYLLGPDSKEHKATIVKATATPE